MQHVLDNPAWNALISGNGNLAFGDDEIKYFDREVSPFAAFSQNTNENFVRLGELLPQGSPVLFVSPAEIVVPGVWKVLRMIHGVQMICGNGKVNDDPPANLVPLTEEHIPQMLELTKLTNPGPFNTKTIDFGHYQGVFEDGQLVAMAGQRLHAFNYAEVSAVCTRPGYTGKGCARELIQSQISRIRAAGEIPFLHSRADNERAIRVYERLGFEIRIPVWFYFMVKG